MIERNRLQALKNRELERFCGERPRSLALLDEARQVMPDGVPMAWMNYHYEHPTIFVESAEGAYITDVDGHRYLDMNLSDMSMATGYAVPAVASAVDAQFRKGAQMLLPTEDAIVVARELAHRFGLPRWQFTLAASMANTEAIRVARARTGRDDVLVFDGKYHGHIDPTMQEPGGQGAVPEFRGLLGSSGAHTRIVPFNDLEALEASLRDEGVACVLTEPAFTTVGGILMPEPGFHEGLRELTMRYGTQLIIDETHTHVACYGGLCRAWRLEPDILVLGKALAGGIPIGAYGLTEPLARFMEQPDGAPSEEPLRESRHRRHAVRQRPANGGSARDPGARADRRSPVPRRGARGAAGRTGSRDRSRHGACRGRCGACTTGPATTSPPSCRATSDSSRRWMTVNCEATRASISPTGGCGKRSATPAPPSRCRPAAEDVDLYLDVLGQCFDTLGG